MAWYMCMHMHHHLRELQDEVRELTVRDRLEAGHGVGADGLVCELGVEQLEGGHRLEGCPRAQHRVHLAHLGGEEWHMAGSGMVSMPIVSTPYSHSK